MESLGEKVPLSLTTQGGQEDAAGERISQDGTRSHARDTKVPATAHTKTPSLLALLPRAERKAMGKAFREKCPRVSHAEWKPPHNRPDPVRLVLKADEGRLPDLLPIRHGHMALSPFTFYRGSALAMAVDLAGTPATGVRVQCGGDSHLVNFRGLATPERQIIFAINDLDETLPAPWKWDLKRLAASFVIACRDNGLSANPSPRIRSSPVSRRTPSIWPNSAK